jgi:hypothetical protein
MRTKEDMHYVTCTAYHFSAPLIFFCVNRKVCALPKYLSFKSINGSYTFFQSGQRMICSNTLTGSELRAYAALTNYTRIIYIYLLMIHIRAS